MTRGADSAAEADAGRRRARGTDRGRRGGRFRRRRSAADLLWCVLGAGLVLLMGSAPPRAAAEDEAPRAPAVAARGLPARFPPARAKALRAGGGNAASEATVQRALDWLAAHQDEDGRLDADGFMKHDPAEDRCDGAGGGHHGARVPCPYDGVTTATALMAWLASGSTPRKGPYAKHVARALAWCRGVVDGAPGGAYGMWNYGFCTQAVADAWWMLRADEDRPRLERAVRRIVDRQLPDGGWSYYQRIGDVPTTGVAAVALGLCARGGIDVPASSIAATLRFLDARVHPEKGRSEYHAGAERKGYTPTRANAATALAVRALFGTLEKTRLLGKQLAAIHEKPVWKISFKEVKANGRTVRAQIGNLYPYRWYYTTLACFERGGSTWSRWYGPLRAALRKGQRREGACAGSWDPLGTYSSSAGRAFITALCALMLQAPYRYPRTP